jgi:hypothetical protein
MIVPKSSRFMFRCFRYICSPAENPWLKRTMLRYLGVLAVVMLVVSSIWKQLVILLTISALKRRSVVPKRKDLFTFLFFRIQFCWLPIGKLYVFKALSGLESKISRVSRHDIPNSLTWKPSRILASMSRETNTTSFSYTPVFKPRYRWSRSMLALSAA